MKRRGFAVVTAYKDKGISLPRRSTQGSAGYDFEAAGDVELKAKSLQPVLIATGIKAYMADDEFLMLANRSSNPLKRGLLMANGIGVIDADYYDNPDNEGHIHFQFINCSDHDITIRKGEKIGQGIFLHYGLSDDDQAGGQRLGGFGSTGK